MVSQSKISKRIVCATVAAISLMAGLAVSSFSGGASVPQVSKTAGYGMPGRAVDLGLSVLWSDQNIGASGPDDAGRLFGYGDISGAVTTCSYADYVSQDVVGTDRDPAYVFWGGGWRMPTASEVNELVERCEWRWTVRDGVEGYVVKGRSGSIFLPTTGQRSGKEVSYAKTRGYYWSGEVSEADDDYASALFFYRGGHVLKEYRRFYGFAIRPVKEEF